MSRSLATVLLCGWALLAESSSPVTIVKYNDGGIAARLFVLADGGAMEEFADGGRKVVPVEESTCVADAGALTALLRQRSCERSSDCAVVQPDVDASNIRCCYAVELAVARSQSLADATSAVAAQCGWASGMCASPCERAVCRRGQCYVLGAH